MLKEEFRTRKSKSFLEPSLKDLHDPYLLHDMDRSSDWLNHAIEEGKYSHHGDYDADGMTSASIEEIAFLLVLVPSYLPSRFYRWLMLVFINTLSNKGFLDGVIVDGGVAEAIRLAQS